MRRPWGFSPEARRGSQGASRAAPGKSGLHARGEGERPSQRFQLPAEVAGRPGDSAFPGRTGSVARRTGAPTLAKEGGRGRRLGTTSRGDSEASPGGIPSPGQPVRRMVPSVGHPEGFSLLTAGCLTISALGFARAWPICSGILLRLPGVNLALGHSLCVFPVPPQTLLSPGKAPPPAVAPRPRARPRLMPSSSIKEKQGPLQELFGT